MESECESFKLASMCLQHQDHHLMIRLGQENNATVFFFLHKSSFLKPFLVSVLRSPNQPNQIFVAVSYLCAAAVKDVLFRDCLTAAQDYLQYFGKIL